MEPVAVRSKPVRTESPRIPVSVVEAHPLYRDLLKHAMGAYRHNDALLYINPGTGYWGIPFRLGALVFRVGLERSLQRGPDR